VAAFIAAEDQNFSMFNYVNTLNQEAEKLEEQATELQQELEHQTGTGVSDDSHWTRLLGVRLPPSLGWRSADSIGRRAWVSTSRRQRRAQPRSPPNSRRRRARWRG